MNKLISSDTQPGLLFYSPPRLPSRERLSDASASGYVPIDRLDDYFVRQITEISCRVPMHENPCILALQLLAQAI